MKAPFKIACKIPLI